MAEEAKYNHQNVEKKGDEPRDHGVATPVKVEEYGAPPPVEATERGWFDFMGKKKEEKNYGEEVVAPPFEEKVQVSEPECKKEEKEEEIRHEPPPVEEATEHGFDFPVPEKIREEKKSGEEVMRFEERVQVSEPEWKKEEKEEEKRHEMPHVEEATEHGFDFTEKKREEKKRGDEVIAPRFEERVQVSEPEWKKEAKEEEIRHEPTPVHEATEHGFDFTEKKREEKKRGEEVIAPRFEDRVQVSEPEWKKEEKEEEIRNEPRPVEEATEQFDFTEKKREEKKSGDEVISPRFEERVQVSEPEWKKAEKEEEIRHEPPPVEEATEYGFDFTEKKREEKKRGEEVMAPRFEERVQVSEPEWKKAVKEEEIRHEPPPVEEASEHGFDFTEKKSEEKKRGEEVIAPRFEEKVQVSEPESKKEEKEEEKRHEGLLQKLQRTSISSSDEEEVEEGGEKKKKKKKKGLKISGDNKEEEKFEKYENSYEPVEKYDEIAVHEESEPEEKKGFLKKMKEKLHGGKKNTDELDVPSGECASPDGEAKEKKGFLSKMKDKIPGYHSKTEEEKEKE